MNGPDQAAPLLILPEGTRVVTRVEVKGHDGRVRRPEGAVAVIVSPPQDNRHAYRVRFADGEEAMLRRHELMVFSHFQQGPGNAPLADYNLFERVIYRCVVGSRAYGLDETDSDYDRRGVYLPPAELHWSLYGVPEQIEDRATDEVYWELQKFILLALRANPNVLECLYTPLVEHAAPLAEELRSVREIFLSQLIYHTFNGYALSQFKKMGQDLRNKGVIRWKHAMHLIRLLLAGIKALDEGYLPVRVEEHREELLAIRNESFSWDELERWRLRLHRGFDRALAATSLPPRPDYERANAFLVKARRSMVTHEP